jgi:hypothetical protein
LHHDVDLVDGVAVALQLREAAAHDGARVVAVAPGPHRGRLEARVGLRRVDLRAARAEDALAVRAPGGARHDGDDGDARAGAGGLCAQDGAVAALHVGGQGGGEVGVRGQGHAEVVGDVALGVLQGALVVHLPGGQRLGEAAGWFAQGLVHAFARRGRPLVFSSENWLPELGALD